MTPQSPDIQVRSPRADEVAPVAQPSAAPAPLHGRWLWVARALWLGLFLLPVALFLIGLPPFFHAQRAISIGQAIYLVALDVLFMAGFALVAALIFWRRSDDWFSLLVSIGLVMTGARFSNQVIFLGQTAPGWEVAVTLVNFIAAFITLVFLTCFPDGRLVPRSIWPVLVVWFCWVVVWQWFPAPINPVAQFPLAARLFDMLLLSSGIYAQITRYRHHAGPVQRQQTKWVIYGVIVGIAGYYGFRLLLLVFPILQETALYSTVVLPMFYAFLLLIPLSIGVSILRFRLWDIDPLIYQTLIYSTLTALLTAIYVVSVVVLQSTFRTVTGQESDLALVAATLLIAALFQPLRRRVQAGIDRRFYREAINVRHALTAFSREIRSIIELPELLSVLARRITELMHARHAAVFMGDDENRLVLANWWTDERGGGRATRPALDQITEKATLSVEPDQVPIDSPVSRPRDQVFPLLVPLVAPASAQGEAARLVGVLALGPRLGEHPYSSDDQALLMIVGDQAGTAIHVAQLVAEKREVDREMESAWQIQQSFLPRSLPEIPGWQLTAVLKPARETCGDFYDVIPLPDGRYGLLIADVVDKGMAAALYMALSRTIIRTYALSQVSRPNRVLKEANERIMQDTHGSHFVTAFYAILDPRQGTLDYANAGHNPPHLLPFGRQGAEPIRLIRTGIPLGILADAAWECESVRMLPGDALVLYTDGITEAQDRRQAEFGEARLAEVLQDQRGQPATEIQQAILNAVRDFIGTAPQSDDLAVMVLVRGEAGTGPDEHCQPRGSHPHV